MNVYSFTANKYIVPNLICIKLKRLNTSFGIQPNYSLTEKLYQTLSLFFVLFNVKGSHFLSCLL